MQNRWIMPRSIEGAPWNVFFSFVFRVVYAVKEIRRGMRIKFEGHANWVNRTKTWIELATSRLQNGGCAILSPVLFFPNSGASKQPKRCLFFAPPRDSPRSSTSIRQSQSKPPNKVCSRATKIIPFGAPTPLRST
jgi:hypothetical protein